MKLTYTGKAQEFPSRQQEKLDAKLRIIAKLLDRGGGEREARVIITQERHLHNVEITVHAFDHALAGFGSNREVFTALTEAVDKLEKQAVKMRAKWRTTKRHKDAPHRTPEEAEATARGEAALNGSTSRAGRKATSAAKPTPSASPEGVRVFKANQHEQRKPMTVDEAMLEIGATDEYLVYRDAHTERVSVLLRRKDGHFDLVEG